MTVHFLSPSPLFFPRSQCTTVSYNERTRIFTPPPPAPLLRYEGKNSIANVCIIIQSKQLHLPVHVCTCKALKRAGGGVGGMDMDALLLVKPVSLVYCNMYNVSKLVSVGRFNIQTNKKLPCKNSTPFICES